MPTLQPTPSSSFRDPDGRVVDLGDRIVRTVAPQAQERVATLLSSETLQRYADQDQLVATHRLTDAERDRQLEASIREATGREPPSQLLEHERIPFPTYPHEWPAEMLHAAGQLTIDLAQDLHREGLGLKDATPANVLFRGPDPVFVDLFSVEERDPNDSAWMASAQFERCFLIPLLVHERTGIPPAELLFTHRDGVPPADAYPLLGPLRRLTPPDLGLVTLPTWLDGQDRADDLDAYEGNHHADPDKAAYVYDKHLDKQADRLQRLAPAPDRSGTHWSDYMATSQYDEQALQAKEAFVEESLAATDPEWVLDAGCNTGHFSQIAAETGAHVVAADADPTVVGQAWRRARQHDLGILPVVTDLADPTPATGWANTETLSFIDRARDRFDQVLMLALVHHLLVTEGIPLPRIIDLAADLTRDSLVIEHVGPEDAMFQRLLKGRGHLHENHTSQRFEAVLAERFTIEDRCKLPGLDRRLYRARVRDQG